MPEPRPTRGTARRLVSTGVAVTGLCLAGGFVRADVPPPLSTNRMPHDVGVRPAFAEHVHESLTRVGVRDTPAAGDQAAALAAVRALCGAQPSVTYRRAVVVREIDLPEVEPKGTLLEFAVIGLPLSFRDSDGYDLLHRSVDCDVLVGERDHQVRYVIGHRRPGGRSLALPRGEEPVRRCLGDSLGQPTAGGGLTGSLASLLGQAWGHGVPVLGGSYFVVRPIGIDWGERSRSLTVHENCALLSVIGCAPDTGAVDPFRGSQTNDVYDTVTGAYLFGFPTP